MRSMFLLRCLIVEGLYLLLFEQIGQVFFVGVQSQMNIGGIHQLVQCFPCGHVMSCAVMDFGHKTVDRRTYRYLAKHGLLIQLLQIQTQQAQLFAQGFGLYLHGAQFTAQIPQGFGIASAR